MFKLLSWNSNEKYSLFYTMHFNILPDPDVYIFVTYFLSKVQLSQLGRAPDQSFTSFLRTILNQPIEP